MSIEPETSPAPQTGERETEPKRDDSFIEFQVPDELAPQTAS
jgi:hypothetical protein